MGTRYDVVYYWAGGSQNGEWREAQPGVWPERLTMEQLLANLIRAGFVAHRGLRSIGAPEGPPSREDFELYQGSA